MFDKTTAVLQLMKIYIERYLKSLDFYCFLEEIDFPFGWGIDPGQGNQQSVWRFSVLNHLFPAQEKEGQLLVGLESD